MQANCPSQFEYSIETAVYIVRMPAVMAEFSAGQMQTNTGQRLFSLVFSAIFTIFGSGWAEWFKQTKIMINSHLLQ